MLPFHIYSGSFPIEAMQKILLLPLLSQMGTPKPYRLVCSLFKALCPSLNSVTYPASILYRDFTLGPFSY
jgi:hypothetical protein